MSSAGPIAMKGYTSWGGPLIDPALWLPALCLASMALFALHLIYDRRPVEPYFSGWFFVALCPCLCCSLLGMIHTDEWRWIGNSVEKLGDVVRYERFGFIVSLTEIFAYSVVHIVRRRRLSMLPTSPVIS